MHELFRRLDLIVENPQAVLASNTSSIPIMKLGISTTRPQHVIGIHFFNPVHALPLVELVPSLPTKNETRRRKGSEKFTQLAAAGAFGSVLERAWKRYIGRPARNQAVQLIYAVSDLFGGKLDVVAVVG